MRRLHKAFLRYHDPENWPVLREALKRMGRADLIGNGKHHLIPAYQPVAPAAGRSGARGRRPGRSGRSTPACRGPATAVGGSPAPAHGHSAGAQGRGPGAAPPASAKRRTVR